MEQVTDLGYDEIKSFKLAFWRFEVFSYLLNANYKKCTIPMNKFYTL